MIGYYCTNDFLPQTIEKLWFIFTKRTIVFNEQLYWLKDFTERLFTEKMNEIEGKWTIILRTNKINFFGRLQKTERNGSFTNDERIKWIKTERTHLYLGSILDIYKGLNRRQWPTKNKIVLQNCVTKLCYKIVLQNCVTKLCYKIALQSYRLLFQWAEEDALDKSILDPWT